MLSTQVRNLKVHEGAVHVVKYNNNGGYFLSGGQDRRIILQNASTGAQIKTYEAHGTNSHLTYSNEYRLGSPRYQYLR
jgi:WD40 repeat protein